MLRDLVTVEGPDAATYLQGQLSQDVAALAPGGSALSFLLEPQGRIVAIVRVARRHDERFELDVEPGLGAAVLARLQRFKLRTKAEITVEADVPFVAHRADVPAPEGALVPLVPGSSGWDLARGDDSLCAEPEVLHDERVRAGVPFVHDLDERVVPGETGLVDAAASFTKGCYTGQELVARMDSRVAEPPRRIRLVTGTGVVPPVGAAVTLDGRPAGTITSVTTDGTGWVGMVLVPRAIGEGEAAVAWPDGTTVGQLAP